MTTKESFVGSLTLDIPPKQAREVSMILKLSLDENCILHTSAWVDGDSLTYYSEDIIRNRKVYTQSEIEEMIRLGEEMKEEDIRETERMKIQLLWESLHENVISFVKKYRFEVENRSIRDKFNEIEKLANSKLKTKISDTFDYNFMVDRYIDMFEDYNMHVSIFKQTNFLKHI